MGYRLCRAALRRAGRWGGGERRRQPGQHSGGDRRPWLSRPPHPGPRTGTLFPLPSVVRSRARWVKLRLYLWDTQVSCFKLEHVIASGGIRVTCPGGQRAWPKHRSRGGFTGLGRDPRPRALRRGRAWDPAGTRGRCSAPAVTQRPLRAHSEEGAGPSTF